MWTPISLVVILSLVPVASFIAQGAPLPSIALHLLPEPARESVERAYRDAETNPSDAAASGQLARVLHAWEQWDAAHVAYERARTLAPHTFEWHYLDAVVLQRRARHREAAERLTRATVIDPGYLPARIKLSETLLEAGMWNESAELGMALVKTPASEPFGRIVLGRIAAARGRHDEAIKELQRAVELFPEWGSAYYALALSYRALGRRDDARRALDLHARYGPKWPGADDPILASISALRDDGRSLLQRGLKLAEAGDLPGAIAAHEAALAEDGSLAQAHVNLVSLYGRTKQWEQAEAHYRALLALGEQPADSHYDYGVLLGLQQRWDEAAAAYRLAIRVNPLHARAHNNLGEILERQGQIDAALDAYHRAADSQPSFHLARFNLGRVLLRANRAGEALVELDKLKGVQDADAPRFLYALAVAYLRLGRKPEALKWATEAHRLAVERGQQEVAAAIARDLESIK